MAKVPRPRGSQLELHLAQMKRSRALGYRRAAKLVPPAHCAGELMLGRLALGIDGEDENRQDAPALGFGVLAPSLST